MLIIRQEQIEILNADIRERFIADVMPHLESLFPKRYNELGQDEVRRTIIVGIDKANNYGLTKGVHIIQFIHLMFMRGEDFDAEQAMKEIFLNRLLAAKDKIRQAFRRR